MPNNLANKQTTVCQQLKEHVRGLYSRKEICEEIDDNHHVHATRLTKFKDKTSHPSAAHEHLYRCLDALDTKAASLFTGNSVMAAVFAIFMGRAHHWETAFLGVGLAVVLLSCLFLALAVKVKWSTSQDIEDVLALANSGAGTGTAADAEPNTQAANESDHLADFVKVRAIRTVWYRIALVLGFTSVMILLVYTLYTILKEAACSAGFFELWCESALPVAIRGAS